MKIQLSHYEFELSDKYRSGSVLTSAEAKALNVLRGEKIRNRMARRLEAMVEDKSEVLTGERRAELYAAAKALDETFEFTSRDVTRGRSSSLEAAIREAASAKAEILARERGRDGDEALIKQLYEALLEDPEVEAEGAARVEARNAIALAGLDSL